MSSGYHDDGRRIMGWWGPYQVRRFRPRHVAALAQRGLDIFVPQVGPGRHVGFTIFKGKEAVACIGFRHKWGRVCEGWVLTSNLVVQCPKLLHKLTLHGLEWMERRRGVNRTGARVLVDFTTAQEWALRLGFTFEGLEPRGGPNGEDFFKYGRLAK